MDREFQQTYAPELYRAKGTADHWTAEEQMLTAERALPGRGFTPVAEHRPHVRAALIRSAGGRRCRHARRRRPWFSGFRPAAGA